MLNMETLLYILFFVFMFLAFRSIYIDIRHMVEDEDNDREEEEHSIEEEE